MHQSLEGAISGALSAINPASDDEQSHNIARAVRAWAWNTVLTGAPRDVLRDLLSRRGIRMEPTDAHLLSAEIVQTVVESLMGPAPKGI